MKPNVPVRFPVVAIVAALMMVGCGGGKPVNAPSVPVLTGGSDRVWRTDFERLEFDLRRTVIAIGWGTYDSEVNHEARTVVMRLQAPNERLTMVTAQPQGNNAMRVTVRVGRMGDADFESELLDMLDEKLTGEPGVPRLPMFELPPVQSNP
jgi:hypothetical protein